MATEHQPMVVMIEGSDEADAASGHGQQQTVELPQVAKVKEWLQDHQNKDLVLDLPSTVLNKRTTGRYQKNYRERKTHYISQHA